MDMALVCYADVAGSSPAHGIESTETVASCVLSLDHNCYLLCNGMRILANSMKHQTKENDNAWQTLYM